MASNHRILFPTVTGRLLDPLSLAVTDVSFLDIAHSLCHQNRYAGHGARFYSVGEHTIRVYQICCALHLEPTVRIQAILHDASECYLVDLPKPLKYNTELGRLYGNLEDHISRVIHTRFNIPYPARFPVPQIDAAICPHEMRMLGLPIDPAIRLRAPRVDSPHDDVLANMDWSKTDRFPSPRSLVNVMVKSLNHEMVALFGPEEARSILRLTIEDNTITDVSVRGGGSNL